MKGYRKVYFNKSSIPSVQKFEGEFLHKKIRRMLEMEEPMGELAPRIFTERKDGVLPDYNIRTDRWEYAAEAMDAVHKANIAKSKGLIEPTDQEGADIKHTKGNPLDDGTGDGKNDVG